MYTGSYSLGTRCLTEFLATFIAIGFGEGIIANEVLPTTKGHALGFGWVAFGFGMSFTFAILIFGFASAHLNPAMLLSLWIRDEISAGDFFALSAAEMCGGFCASVFVYLVYMPHFRTVPEPSGTQDENLLRSRDHIDPSALRFASYSTRSHAFSNSNTLTSHTHPGQKKTLGQRLADARYYLLAENFDTDPETVITHLIGGTYALHGAEVPFPSGTESIGRNTPVPPGADVEAPVQFIPGKASLKRRHSLQVADMQRLLRKMERELESKESPTFVNTNSPAGDLALPSTGPAVGKSSDVPVRPPSNISFRNSLETNQPAQHKLSKQDAIYRAAIIADQATKLSVFATRPAIFLPIHNFFVEMIGTAALIFGASLIDSRFKMIKDPQIQQAEGISLKPFLVGMYIMVLVLGLGGPTGFAANPARDMACRLAHWVLPINGKGSSEMWYGMVINTGMLVGGALGAGFVIAVDQIRGWTIQ
ncbi:hypothetical protein HDU81_006591 [Chytriomyces hyalinus]|nr:hypothetical protein HDU81_006591 [Chytriomyces hyalinus]